MGRARSLVVEGSGRLQSVVNTEEGLDASDLFAIVLLWDADDPGWVGWLTTVKRRALCFSIAELEDAAFRAWLGGLPGWEPARLSLALGNAGLHLVWRRPA